jgi:hypothetical protein
MIIHTSRLNLHCNALGQLSLVVHSNAEPKFICLHFFNVSKALNVFMWLSKNILAYNKYILVEIKFPLLQFFHNYYRSHEILQYVIIIITELNILIGIKLN